MNRDTLAHTVVKGIRLFVVATLLAVLANMAAPPPVAYAATLNVTTSNDELDGAPGNGNCSLREAIDNANADAPNNPDCAPVGAYGADTITFAAATNGVPIVLTLASGDLDILGAGGNLTIQGNGAANTIIDGNNADRVFHVCPAGACANTVTFNGLTIRNGSAPAAGIMGGGIYNQGSTLNVQNSTVSANRAALGGGIYNTIGCNATVTGSTVISNTASNLGGGIYNIGTTTVTGSRILNNTAAVGGGIHNQINVAGATNVTGSCIVGNSANSFQNDMAAQQTATGNWWGAATGPNTSCADTTGGNVNTAGFLSAPILGCPANCSDLQVVKANDTGGSGTVGTPFNWTLTISNTDAADATFNVPQVILADDLPAGPTYGAPAPGNFSNITNTANISCTIALNTLTCDAVGADVTIGGVSGSFDVVVPVTPNAAETMSNPPAGSNCRVDPDDNVAESDEGNNDCPADNVNVAAPDLQVDKANDTGGTGTVGTAFNWTLTVSNPGGTAAAFTAGQRIVEDDLPAGPSYGALAPGNFANITNPGNITCTIAANTLTCDAVGADVTIGATTGSFDVVVPVTPNAAGILNNPRSGGTCRVDPDDNVVETDEGNNDCPANSVNVLAPDLQVNKANDTGGTGTVGTAFNWTLTVANIGGVDATFTAGERIVEDDLPAGPSYGALAPGNFTNITNTANIICTIAANTLTCDAAGADVTIGAATGSFDIVLSVTPNAAGILNNPRGVGTCRVDPNDNMVESDESNNDCANNVNVAALAPTPSPPDGGDDDDDEPAPPPPPTPIPAPKAQEFNCWPWLVIVPPGAAPNAVPGEWCQASLGQPLPLVSTFRYLGHSTDVTVKDAAGMVITSFARPIKVCFHYTQPELGAVGGDPASFLIQVFRDGKWEALDTKPEGSLSHPGVCAPVSHLTLFALFARDGARPDASVAAASDSELLFPTHLPETGERLLGSGGWGLLVAGVAILAMGVSAWLLRRR
jgi:CSLREA domain-containing protein